MGPPGEGAPASEGLSSVEARLRLLRLADELAHIHPLPATSPESSGAEPSQGLLLRGVKWAARRLLLGSSDHPRTSSVHHPDSVSIDDPLDTGWADPSQRFGDLTHLFHQEWHGIRAAAGYLPGRKIAVAAEQRLSLRNLQTVVETCGRGTHTVLLHGWSENAALLVHALRETLGTSIKLKVIWHGNTSQFINPYEQRQVAQLIDFCRRGLLDGLGSVKPDLHLLHQAFSPQVLLNVAPSGVTPSRPSSPRDIALIPVPLDWRKNLHTNLYAAAAAGLRRVYVTAPLPKGLPLRPSIEVIALPRPTRQALFTLIGEVDVILNASLSECQPMTALEGLALGVPCITGPLALGELDEHPYQRLVQVNAVDTLGPVVRAITAVRERLKQAPGELAETMVHYERGLRREAFVRLERFVE